VKEAVDDAAQSQIGGYDPVELAKKLEPLVSRGDLRKYYRFRPTRFYGGIATGDVVGCNLRCVFCWTGPSRDDVRMGFWVSGSEAYEKLSSIASAHGFTKMRLSGGEPTLGWSHLLDLLSYVDSGDKLFVLETNGVLIGAYPSRARQLSEFRNVHVRVSIKACSPELFAMLTGAKPEAFELQIRAARNLLDHGVSFHVAAMVSFGDERCWARFLEKLAEEVGAEVALNIEPELVKMYPHVARRLKAAGISPLRYLNP
jgi:uncharacterized Fe-S cluster-containing radical SAM superfamily protein